MLFDVVHTTTYRYSRPVFLEPHTVRLCPRSGADQRLLRFEMKISPQPAGLTCSLDAEGNTIHYAWFNGKTEQLVVTTHWQAETLRANPFDFLPRKENIGLPMRYRDSTASVLAASLQRNSADAGGKNDEIAAFASTLAQAHSQEDAAGFLSTLNETLYKDWETIHRDEGPPWPPEQTLRDKCGSCRDLAVLFIDAARAMGIATRFVSGYQEGDPDQQEPRELHAWVEVYVPGGGWRGYDPTHGLVVADGHVAVCASAFAERAASVSGSFRGTGATAKMEHHIEIKTAASATVQQQQQQQQG